MLIFVLKNKFI